MELTLKQKTAFGIGAVGKDMVYALSASYVMYYYPVSYTHLDVYKRQVCDPAGKDADRRKPVGGVFPPDGSASAAGGLWCGHRAACAHFAGYGGAAPVLLSVPLPHGSGVCPAAGAAICAAAPAERCLLYTSPYRCRHHHSGGKAGEGALDAVTQRVFQKEHTARPKTCAQKGDQNPPECVLYHVVPPCG